MENLLHDNRLDFKKIIQNTNRITLLTHINPDGDGISACAALEHILKNLGKHVETIYPSKPAVDFVRTPHNFCINSHVQIPDLIIICDTSNIERTYYPKKFANIPVLNIDHHVSNTITGTYNIIMPEASSTCEVLYFMLHDLIDPYTANCLLCGILSDSQLFQTQSTSQQTLEVAAHLMHYGADLYQLKQELLRTKTPQNIMLWGSIMNTLHTTAENKAVIASVTQKDLNRYKQTEASLDGFVNFLAQMSETDITILVYETNEGKNKVSVRSKVSDVHAFATLFGGGGHKHAAGFFSPLPIDQVIAQLVEQLNKHL